MTHLWHDIKAGDKVPSKINIVIEIPMGSKCKYELSRTTGSIRVDRILATAMTYPQNYGFVPQTLCEDGDPLDALLLSQVPIFPGTFIKARPIGIVHMIDQKQKDDKLICVATEDPKFADYNDIKDLPKQTLKEIEEFFRFYKRLEGKKTKVKGHSGKIKAFSLIKKYVAAYNKKFKKK